MAIHKIMSTKLVSVTPEATVADMQKLLEQHPIHHLLVIDENDTLQGLVSDRDILRILSPYLNTKVETEKDLFTLTRKAHQLMTKELVSISPSTSIQEAARTLIDKKVSLLPVVDDEGHPVGVLSWKDVMRYIMD